jgi:hypothetical protein
VIPLGQTDDLIKLMAEIAQLKEEVERLRTREAALRESLEVYADPHFWQLQSLVPLGGFNAVNVIPAARDGGEKAREALAADPSAPATEERP